MLCNGCCHDVYSCVYCISVYKKVVEDVIVVLE
jgi:hypothetical protein